MSTWFVGDVHGCAAELGDLLERIAPGTDDRVVMLGDLYHRGPDPAGVVDRLRGVPRVDVVLGNHERAMLRRLRLAGERVDGSDAQAPDPDWRAPDADALRGDKGSPMADEALARAREIVAFVATRPYLLRGDGWIAVHGSVLPGVPPERQHPRQLCSLQRCADLPGAPPWHDGWQGPEVVYFGHRRSGAGPHRNAAGRVVAVGLDTGCVYGGTLTACCHESGARVAVPARAAYAQPS